MIKSCNQPLVSICIPTYNGMRFIKAALNSIKKQTYQNLEVIISDDNSKDETVKILEDFKNETSFPVFLFHHSPSSIGANWNNCVKNANGDYIKFLFQDDVLFPKCVERMMEIVITNNFEVGMVYCKRSIIVEDVNKRSKQWVKNYSLLHNRWSQLTVDSGVICGNSYLRDKNLFIHPDNKIGEPSAVLINSKCFTKIGFFNTKLRQVLDVEFWYRVMKHYKIAFVNEELVGFRLHEDQATRINSINNHNDGKYMYWIYLNSIFWNLSLHNKLILLKRVVKSILN